MLSKRIEIRNSVGLHARPAAQLAERARRFESDIWVCYRDRSVDAKSVVRLLSLGINAGEIVELVVYGKDETAAFEDMKAIFDEVNRQ